MAVGSILGGILGNVFGGEDRDRAQQEMQEAAAGITNIQLPDIEQLRLQLEDYRSAGKITPAQEEAILQQASGMSQISTDPRLKQAQMSALEKLQQVGQAGLLPQDKAVLASLQRDTERQAQARNASILQDMAARGAGGSGAELAMQLANNQAATERQAQGSTDLASQANMRALQAIAQAGSLSGNIRQQEFGEEEAKAKAQDIINQFNAANRQNVQARNVASQNQAQTANVAAAQQIANANVGQHNYQQQYNRNLAVEDYQRRLEQARAAANARQGLANMYQQNANRTGQMWSGMGNSLDQGLASVAGAISGNPSNSSSNKKINEQNNT